MRHQKDDTQKNSDQPRYTSSDPMYSPIASKHFCQKINWRCHLWMWTQRLLIYGGLNACCSWRINAKSVDSGVRPFIYQGVACQSMYSVECFSKLREGLQKNAFLKKFSQMCEPTHPPQGFCEIWENKRWVGFWTVWESAIPPTHTWGGLPVFWHICSWSSVYQEPL